MAKRREQRAGVKADSSKLKVRKSEIRNQKPFLLFTGTMDYHANVDGVIWFCNKVFPTVKGEFPEAQFYIVGSNPHPRVRDLGNRSGVKVTGFVEDIRPYYQAADLCVVPLRMARGIQNKVLEAMAMGKNARKAVEQKYHWETNLQQLEDLIETRAW